MSNLLHISIYFCFKNGWKLKKILTLFESLVENLNHKVMINFGWEKINCQNPIHFKNVLEKTGKNCWLTFYENKWILVLELTKIKNKMNSFRWWSEMKKSFSRTGKICTTELHNVKVVWVLSWSFVIEPFI